VEGTRYIGDIVQYISLQLKQTPMAAALPAFLFSSPVGLHICDFHSFVQSDFIAPVSGDQEKSVQTPYIVIES
jgi:hypothetical protein